MPRSRSAYAAAIAIGAALAVIAASPSPDDRATLAARVLSLGRDARWTRVDAVPVAFKTFHPQGMVKIGDTLFVSSVEVRVPPRRLAAPVDGYDREPGEGVGHLFKIGRDGRQLGDLTLGEGPIYHPGGIDYDGTSLWVPVAEYRPNSRSIIYRVDPQTMTATKVLSFPDHIGAIVHDTATNTLHGASWGSRRFYRWTLDRQGRVTNAAATPASLRRLNPSHYVDYQDCKSAGPERMLCTGVAELRPPPGEAASSRSSQAPSTSRAPSPPPFASFRLGGLELVDLKEGRPIHQVPVLLWTASGVPMTQNPAWFEPHGAGLRAWFMPEDDASTIYIYDVSGVSP